MLGSYDESIKGKALVLPHSYDSTLYPETAGESTKSKKLISQLSYYSTSNKKGQKEFDGSCYTLLDHNTGYVHLKTKPQQVRQGKTQDFAALSTLDLMLLLAPRSNRT